MKCIVENKIKIGNEEYVYIIQRKKIKNIYFRVKEDLKIYVSCGKLVPTSFIEDLLIKNENAIIRMMNTMKNRSSYSDELYYLGNKLNFIISNCEPYMDNSYIYARNIEEAKDYIFSLAYDVFNNRLKQIVHEFDNLPKFTLKIRNMKSKWGVCNIKSMSITLNTNLIMKDIHLIDYVIIHELCHFKYMDHSKNFWNYVASFYPYYKEARRELNH